VNIGNLILVVIIAGVIVQLVGMHRRAQRERAAAPPDALQSSAEQGAEDQLPDDEVPPGYVIDERRADGRIVLRPATDGERMDRENVGR
jgi:hypothetical protein